MATVVAPTREDTWLVTCTIDGVDLGTFGTKSGGEVDSEETKHRPGGMAAEISLGGARTIGNLTIGRYCDRIRDWSRIKWLQGRAGVGRGSIGVTPLDANALVGGETLTYNGTLKMVTPPEVDSTGTDAAILELEFTIDGVA